jgi:hypothetical protein
MDHMTEIYFLRAMTQLESARVLCSLLSDVTYMASVLLSEVYKPSYCESFGLNLVVIVKVE